jgi:hypothetical protein
VTEPLVGFAARMVTVLAELTKQLGTRPRLSPIIVAVHGMEVVAPLAVAVEKVDVLVAARAVKLIVV